MSWQTTVEMRLKPNVGPERWQAVHVSRHVTWSEAHDHATEQLQSFRTSRLGCRFTIRWVD